MHHVWGIPVALDLFFAGLGAGLFLVAVTADLLGGKRFAGARRVGGILAPWPVLLGVLLLIIDLGNPQRFWEFVLMHDFSSPVLNYRPSSVMSTGTWLLVIFSIISLCYFLLSLIRWPFAWDEKVRRGFGLAGMPFALLVTIYTGVLISGTAVPLWDTAMLPILFVSSAILAGVATTVFFMGMRPIVGLVPSDKRAMDSLSLSQTGLAALVLVLSLVFFATKGAAAPEAGWALWWLFVVVLGLLVPLAFGFVRPKLPLAAATPAVAALAVLGAFFLRYTILMNGQA